MNYNALIQNRKSTREFKDREVTFAQLETIQNYYYNSVRRLIPEIKTELYAFGPGTGAGVNKQKSVQVTLPGVASEPKTVKF